MDLGTATEASTGFPLPPPTPEEDGGALSEQWKTLSETEALLQR